MFLTINPYCSKRHWYTKNLCRSHFFKVANYDMLFGLGQWQHHSDRLVPNFISS
jgi:hypothetical protein